MIKSTQPKEAGIMPDEPNREEAAKEEVAAAQEHMTKARAIRRPTEHELREGRKYADAVVSVIPPRWRPLAAGAVGLVFLVLTMLFLAEPMGLYDTGSKTPSYALPDCYLATAILAPGADGLARDVNMVVRNGQAQVIQPVLDQTGHAALPVVENCGPTGQIDPNSTQVAPIMGWNVRFMNEVFGGTRPLRFCNQERKTFDQQNGKQTAAIAERAVRAVFDNAFEIKSSVEDCSNADFVLGANAEVDCGGPAAWGCAALGWKSNNQPFVRITFNGAKHISGEIPANCIEFGIDWHELKHGGDLGHTGGYGGEGKAHSHKSDMGYINSSNCRPMDNPTGPPAIEDWLAEDGHNFRYNAKLRNPNPSPRPSPTATSTPTPTPTPSPSLPPTARTAWTYFWVSNAQGGWTLVGQAEHPIVVGNNCVVEAVNGQHRGQVCYNYTGTEPDAVGPHLPVLPR
jgi:hypothetical protein